jgi:spore maturation protein CgeB
MRVYIKDHPFAAGKWIYRGYKSAWESLGHEAVLYNNLSDIKDEDYQIMAIDHDIRSEEHVKILENASRAYLFVQPHTFPMPWGSHPNFISQVPRDLTLRINSLTNIFKWSFVDAAKTNFYKEWDDVHYIPLAYDSENYKDLSKDKYSFDVCYVGGWANNGFDEKKKIIIDYLSVFKGSGLRCGFAVNQGISHEKENSLLSLSKVALNIHDAYQHNLGVDTNERTFKSLGLCGILVSDNVECLKGLFPNVPLATNPKEMLKITKEICVQPDSLLLGAKAKNRENILSKHTYIERVKTMLSLNNES